MAETTRPLRLSYIMFDIFGVMGVDRDITQQDATARRDRFGEQIIQKNYPVIQVGEEKGTRALICQAKDQHFPTWESESRIG